jgi:hypothetical protein
MCLPLICLSLNYLVEPERHRVICGRRAIYENNTSNGYERYVELNRPSYYI